ncbi:slit homolog 2 protein-like [Octopus sinensis]|uniref:Slit homolog 2 protein-like n=1 Tax=Octopus sinensis TaxID=2607531 RepID=A0A6P7SP30_9MOLL|nr:slit homolog 2 protein-like [Octopus sinensis]XP_029640046.1 slit homolog 2 protein-like [Octopus sinensis]XP_036361176.1 slit homolog 2 protein-like [Octopus sinensis]
MESSRKYWSVLILLVCCFEITYASKKRCPVECKCSGFKIECFSPSFPIHIPNKEIQSLSIRGKLQDIQGKAIVYHKEGSLLQLEINVDCINEIKPLAFAGTVKTIKFTAKHVFKINRHAFSNIDCQNFYIRDSNISFISGFAFGNISCNRLEVKNSNIYTLDTDAFSVSHIGYVICAFNTFNCIGKNALVRTNDFEMIENTIHQFHKQDTLPVAFRKNKLTCDCSLKWFSTKENSAMPNNTCSGPPRYKGKVIQSEMFDSCNTDTESTTECPIANISNILKWNMLVSSALLVITLIGFR